MGMERMSLLEALTTTKAFAPKFAGVALDECAVRVCASTSDEEPSVDEAASARDLKTAKSLGDLVAGLTPAPGAGTYLFVDVLLPPAAPRRAR